MKNRKLISGLLAATLVAALVFAGCGNSGSSAASSAASAASSAVEEAASAVEEAASEVEAAAEEEVEEAVDEAEAEAAVEEAAEAVEEDAEDDAVAEAAAEASDGDMLSGEERSKLEVYQYVDDIAFGGIPTPYLESRADIEKALPAAGETKSDLHLGWSTWTLSNSYFAGTEIGFKEQCEKYGYEATFLNSDGDPTQQSADISSLITMGVDGIIVDPQDTQAQLMDCRRAVEAGIPVIASGVPFGADAPVITTITSSNFEGGYITGMYVAETYPEELTMAYIIGQLGHPVANARANGFLCGFVYERQIQAGTALPYREEAMLEGYNLFKDLAANGNVKSDEYGINIVAMGYGSWSEMEGMTAAEDIITAHPEITHIFAENDHMGEGAYKVVKERGLEDQITISSAADGDAVGIGLVRDGHLLTTGYNNSVAISKRCVDLFHDIFEDGYDANNMPIMTALPVICVTKDNWEEVYEEGSDYAKELDIPFITVDEYNEMNA
jgi:ribose transport system substrate-binding protein